MAEFVCRAVDRNDPPRVRGAHRGAGRDAPASDPAGICSLLQYGENAPVIEPGCSRLSPGSADRTNRVARPGWRAASPIRPDLGFRHSQEWGFATMLRTSNSADLTVSISRPGMASRDGVIGRQLVDS